MYRTAPQKEMITKTGIRCMSVDASTITSTSTASSDDSTFESFYDLDISRLLAFRRSEASNSIDNEMLSECDCSDITEQDYNMDESFCDADEIGLARTHVSKDANPLNLEIARRRKSWRRLQVFGVCVGGVCVGIPSLLLLLDPKVGRSRRS